LTAIWSATSGAGSAGHIALVHGSLDRSAGLLKLARRLDDRYRVTRYDRRGYGRSSPSAGPFGVDDHVDDLVSVVEQMVRSVRPSVVVGHSYGGNVALAVAERRPDLVDAVVTYETPLSWRNWWPNDSAGSDAVGWSSDPAEAAERFMRRLIGDDRWERLPESTRGSRRREGTAMVGELLDLRARAPWEASAVTVPVLALHGELGQPYHRRGAESIAAEMPAGEYACVRGAKHPGPNTHPDAVAALIDDFVERRVRSASAP
jgi:pimeloyl-ACP methyl ester carboxylesterase